MVIAVSACSSHSSSAPAPTRPTTTTTSTITSRPTTTTPAPTTSTSEVATSTTDPGRLAQTGALPTSSSAHFRAVTAALWRAVVSGTPATAYPAFFPRSAYTRLKGITDPGADYTNRLLGGFAADIRAAHQLLGAAAAGTKLVAVTVPGQYAHWVVPGTCSNTVGYFEVANSRVVYRVNGQLRSFGIASLISWRGEWYVVHLGAIVRSGAGGVVDDPAIGQGVSQPSTSC